MSLRLRVTIMVLVVVAAVVVVVGERVHSAAEAELVEELDLDLQASVATFVGHQRRSLDLRSLFAGSAGPIRPRSPSVVEDSTDPEAALRSAAAREPSARLIDSNGTELLTVGSAFAVGLDPTDFPAFGQRAQMSAGTINDGRARAVTVAVTDGIYLQLARSLDEVDESLRGLQRRIFFIALLALGAAGAAAWTLAGASLRPISALTGAAERVARSGDLGQPVPGRGSGEVGRLARSFNTMLEALNESRAQQRRLVMDASHELRTPLASLQTNIDLLRTRRELPEELRQDIIDDLGAEIDELGTLVAELVVLAADGPEPETRQRISLAQLVVPVAERQERRTGTRVVVDVVEDADVMAEPEAMSRAIRNVIENSAKFSPPEAPIRVVVKGGTVTVHDAGPGIPEEERTLVFQRFYRAERSRSLPGSGLGLAIVAQVVQRHGGRAWVDNSPDGGAAVSISVPVADRPND